MVHTLVSTTREVKCDVVHKDAVAYTGNKTFEVRVMRARHLGEDKYVVCHGISVADADVDFELDPNVYDDKGEAVKASYMIMAPYLAIARRRF